MEEVVAEQIPSDNVPILDVRALLESGKIDDKGDDEEMEGEEEEEGKVKVPLPSVFDVDIGNLLVFDKQEQNENSTPMELTQRSVQELFEQVFNLSVTPSNLGPIAKLPTPETDIPREKPVPKPKPLTRWEKFAKEKGIKKKKKSRMVWDDATGEYRPRWGMKRINDPKENWIVEDKPEELQRYGAEDPFHLEMIKKKERVEKNKKSQVKNLKRSLSAQSAALPPTLDITKNAPKRQKYSLEAAVELAQKSTASMGKFDQLQIGEPKPKSETHLLPSSLPKELAATSKIAERVLKKSQSALNIDKAVREELKKPGKGRTPEKKKKPKPQKKSTRGKKGQKGKGAKAGSSGNSRRKSF
jgi:regulator of ribosome biosynthesis